MNANRTVYCSKNEPNFIEFTVPWFASFKYRMRYIGITRQQQRNQINETQCRQKLDQKRQSSRIPETF